MKRAAKPRGGRTGRTARRYAVLRREDIPPVPCPCGQARRAFGKTGCPASVHWVEIRRDAVAHWHARQTEIYVVLSGRGWLEIDGDRVPLSPGTAVWIQPGARHRARGRLTILNIVVPPFDP